MQPVLPPPLKIPAQPIADLSQIRQGEDLYLVSVTDDAIRPIAQRMKGFGGLWAHTSGSVDADVLSDITDTYGVFYPLQTFTRGITVEMSEVPLYIEGSDAASRQSLLEIAGRISLSV